MVKIPYRKISVLHGNFKPGFSVSASAFVDENGYVEMTIHINFDGVAESPRPITFEKIGSKMIECPLYFSQDIIHLNPEDLEIEDADRPSDARGFKELLAEMAFVRSIHSLCFYIWKRPTGHVCLSRCKISFTQTVDTLEKVDPLGDDDALKYFTHSP